MTRELTNEELDQVAGGFGHFGAPHIGSGSCFQWVPAYGAFVACNLVDPSTGLPYPGSVPQ